MLKKIFNFDTFDNISITGLTNELASFAFNDIYKKSKKSILIVTNSLYESNIIYSSLSKYNSNTYLFPMDDFLTSEALAISPDLLSIRLNTLNSLCDEKQSIVVTNLMGLLRYLPSKEAWKNNYIKLKKGEDIDSEELFRKLITMGYKNETMVTASGELSKRGYIFDIFPIKEDKAVRIEFWGDTIDSIRYFDVDNQRSLEEIDEISITAFSEFINEKGIDIEEKQKYLPMAVDKLSSIYDYLDNPITIIKDYNVILNSYTNLREEINEYDKSLDEHLKTTYIFNLDDIKFVHSFSN